MTKLLASDKLREDFSYRLSRLSRLWRKSLDERLKDLGLTQSRWVTLLYIQRLGGGVTQRELAHALAIESPTLARFMDSLEKDQLISRVCCPSDGRAKRVNLTPQGLDYLQGLNERAAGLREKMLRNVSDADLQACFRVFDQISENAQRLSAGPPVHPAESEAVDSSGSSGD